MKFSKYFKYFLSHLKYDNLKLSIFTMLLTSKTDGVQSEKVIFFCPDSFSLTGFRAATPRKTVISLLQVITVREVIPDTIPSENSHRPSPICKERLCSTHFYPYSRPFIQNAQTSSCCFHGRPAAASARLPAGSREEERAACVDIVEDTREDITRFRV